MEKENNLIPLELEKNNYLNDFIKDHYQKILNVSHIEKITFSFAQDGTTVAFINQKTLDESNKIKLDVLLNGNNLKISKDNPLVKDELQNQDNHLVKDEHSLNEEHQTQDNPLVKDEPQNNGNLLIKNEHQNQDNQLVKDEHSLSDEHLFQDEHQNNGNLLIKNEHQNQDNQLFKDEHSYQDEHHNQSQDFKYPETPNNKQTEEFSKVPEKIKPFNLNGFENPIINPVKKEFKKSGFNNLTESPNDTSAIKISINSSFESLDISNIMQLIKEWKETGFNSNHDIQNNVRPSDFSKDGNLERVKTWVCDKHYMALDDIKESDIIVLLLNPKSKEHLARSSDGKTCPTFKQLSDPLGLLKSDEIFITDKICITDIYPYYSEDYSIPDVEKCIFDVSQQVNRVITKANIIILCGADCCLGFTKSLKYLDIQYKDLSSVFGFPSFLVHNTLVFTVHHPSQFNDNNFKIHSSLVFSISRLLLSTVDESELKKGLYNNYECYFKARDLNQNQDNNQDNNQNNILHENQDGNNENHINNLNEIQKKLLVLYNEMTVEKLKKEFFASGIKRSKFLKEHRVGDYEKSAFYNFFKPVGSPLKQPLIVQDIINYLVLIEHHPK